jgi:glycosyltransferase involved in cell wall biosynthesis
VLSMGRGQQRGSWRWHSAGVRRVGRHVVVYAPFFDAPLLTHLVTMLFLLPLVWRLIRSTSAGTVLLAYNRLPHYLPALELAYRLGYRLFLDLEDGDVSSMLGLRGKVIKFVGRRINALCSNGALLATSSLTKQYPGLRTMCCYGVADSSGHVRTWNGNLYVLLGGTLQHDTGAGLFIDAVAELSRRNDPALDNLKFVVTGKGAMAQTIEALAPTLSRPAVLFKGSLSRQSYQEMLSDIHVGLCLKLSASDLGHTTFPSKVVEITSSGMLLLTTKVSDIPRMFSDEEVLYLPSETPGDLADALQWLLHNRDRASVMARRGTARILSTCAQERVGRDLKSFFFSS